MEASQGRVESIGRARRTVTGEYQLVTWGVGRGTSPVAREGY